MQGNIEGAIPQSPEGTEVQKKRFERAIKKFLKEQWPKNHEAEKSSYGADFDISAPKIDDMKNVQSGDFEITRLQTSPTSNPEKLSFHFYVGGTEFHISGKAADRVYELMEE